MSLADLQYPAPTEQGLAEWLHAHVRHHEAIIGALRDNRGISLELLPIFPLDPSNKDQIAVWNRSHQTMHNQMNQALGIAGTDLTALDPTDQKKMDDFLFGHLQQHRDAAQLSGSPI